MKKYNKTILWIASGLYFVLLAIYFIWFGYNLGKPISNTTESWGQFGDFIRGIANPFFSLMALIALIKTLEFTGEQVELSRESIKKTENHNLVSVYENTVREMANKFESLILEIDQNERPVVREGSNRVISMMNMRILLESNESKKKQLARLATVIKKVVEEGRSKDLQLPFSEYFLWVNAEIPKILYKEKVPIERETVIFFLEGGRKYYPEGDWDLKD